MTTKVTKQKTQKHAKTRMIQLLQKQRVLGSVVVLILNNFYTPTYFFFIFLEKHVSIMYCSN